MVGDSVNGKKLFIKMCAACHTTEKNAKHKAGPNLHGIVGKICGTVRGFNFSKGMKEKNVIWNEKTLNDYMEFPREFIPGTTKMFSVKKAEDRRDLIAYLATLK
ncbi:cytochrome c-like [Pseudomyrmex gracilis]|uniref:cytochrome c-like n=1 Tax=Pseudomyrmex gracilis TaxID=219809 RepID=UPI000995B808|nr:cytochrome c-like [Pseudomyrmex gracilis]